MTATGSAMAEEPGVDAILQPYIGVWSGMAMESGVSESYPMTLCIYENDGKLEQRVFYRGVYDCDGKARMSERGSGWVRFDEVIIRGRHACSDGRVVLSRTGTDSMVWVWSYIDEATVTATAQLSRQNEKCPGNPGHPIS